jgi:uncharacterized protein involved in exopolysaccharide biosynthesis
MLTPQQLRDWFQFVTSALKRHWKLSAAAFAIVLAVTAVGLVLSPRHYYSEARLYVGFGRENVLDPTASSGQIVSVNESRETELNSLLEVLRSHAVCEKLVESLGPDFILNGNPSTAAKTLSTASPVAAQLAENSPAQQQAIQQLEKMLEIWVPRKSNIISIRCRANSPEIAQTIVARLVDIYLHEHVRVHQTAGSYEFFAERTQAARQEWQTASDKLRKLKDQLGIVTIDGKRQLLQSKIADVEGKLLNNRSESNTSQAKIASLQQLTATLPATIVTQEAQAPNAAFDNMRGTLFQLEAKAQELNSTMSDNHPKLQSIREQIGDLRTALDEQAPQRLQSTRAVNPSRQALELSLLNEQSNLQALMGQALSLADLKQRLQTELEQLNGQEATLAQLKQDVDLAEARQRTYAEKLEQASINRSLDEQRISSLSIVQPASYSTRPSGPRRLYVAVLGLITATLSGLGTALALAWFNPLLATAQDLPRLLDLPLVGLIPPPSLAR